MNEFIISLFHFDALSGMMVALITFIGICVGSFAYRYMQGDTQFRPFFFRLILLIISTALMVSADDFTLLFLTSCFSNILLVRLMVHKSIWKAAKSSGDLAMKNFLIGAACLATSLVMFYLSTGKTSIQATILELNESKFMIPALFFLLTSSMTQSAIWPFHHWLTSSLNSPTPVSAFMHAGLVNGGGFLLTRFAPLYLQKSYLLTIIFTIGIGTAIIGTLWKLMQSDIKRMLACSTMGQMGFMFAQCGLGLFSAAMAHLILHGMVKSYLFLSSGGIAQEKRFDPSYPPKPIAFICALICGGAGTFAFASFSNKYWLSGDTTFVLLMIAFLSGTQFSLPILREKTLKKLPLAIILTSVAGSIYGISIQFISQLLQSMQIMQPQPLNGLHLIGIILMTLSWLSILFISKYTKTDTYPSWMLKAYVMALNSSQPHPSTITAHRNQYKFIQMRQK